MTRVIPKTLLERFSLDYFQVTEYDFVSIAHCEPNETLQHHKVLVSSQNAVGSFDLSRNDVWCVGSKTREALEKTGVVVRKSFPSASEMAREAVKSGEPATYLCGSMRMPVVEDVYRSNQVELQVLVVYQTTTTPREFDTNWDAVLFFSPSGVQSFHERNDQTPLAICIGETTADCAQTYGHPIVLSRYKTKEAVVQTAVDYFTL